MKLAINGEFYEVTDGPDRPLLWVIRDELGLPGTKFGCGIGYCGSCTVHVDGQATRACITPVAAVVGKTITTIEGLATKLEDGQWQLHPIQQAFLDEQAPQCSWCMSGQMMTAAALLAANAHPSADEIVAGMGRNYCRCGCYIRIKAAVARAADLMATQETSL